MRDRLGLARQGPQYLRDAKNSISCAAPGCSNFFATAVKPCISAALLMGICIGLISMLLNIYSTASLRILRIGGHDGASSRQRRLRPPNQQCIAGSWVKAIVLHVIPQAVFGQYLVQRKLLRDELREHERDHSILRATPDRNWDHTVASPMPMTPEPPTAARLL